MMASIALGPAPTVTVSSELGAVLRRLKVGQMLDTLPERLTPARQGHYPVPTSWRWCSPTRSFARDRASTSVRGAAAHLDLTMVSEAWDDTARLASIGPPGLSSPPLPALRGDAANSLVLGPVGVGETHFALDSATSPAGGALNALRAG